MKIVKKKLSELVLPEYNPRIITERQFNQLEKSIVEFGYVVPIVWNRRTGHVVSGNQRVKALKELFGNNYEVEVVEIDVDERTEKQINVVMNAVKGDWDNSKLIKLLDELERKGKLHLTGFTETETRKLFEEYGLIREKEEELFTDIEEVLKEQNTVYKITIEFNDAKKYEYVAVAIKKLKSKWKIKDRADVLERLVRLYDGGDRNEGM